MGMNALISRRNFLTTSCASVGLAAVGSSSSLAATPGEPLAMPRRPLGRTGWLTSIVGFGGGSRFLAQSDMEVVERMIHRAIELGINYFDTAFTYLDQNKERESYRRYSRFLVPRYRKQIILVSKLMERDAESAKRSLEITLKELGTDCLDLLHFHALSKKEEVDRIVAPDGALKVYRQWKEQGVIKAIGITGHSSADVLLDAIERIEPDCMMCPLNPAHSGQFVGTDFARLIPVALRRGMGLLAMKTTGRTTLIGRNGVTPEELVRYALNLPVAAAVIGMPDVAVIESCAALARSLQPMPEMERKGLEQKLASAARPPSLPYLAAGYTDGDCPHLG
jgi:predicted aldo/keto reductase-like oxidoreductase